MEVKPPKWFIHGHNSINLKGRKHSEEQNEKHYIEIDGKQHLTLEAIEHDKKRDEWLQSQGWIGIRLPAKGLKEFLYRKYVCL